MRPALLLIVLSAVHINAASKPACNTFTDCNACTSAASWGGANCRYCTVDKLCHEQGSLYNRCSSDENIYYPDKCEGPAPPPPSPPPTDNDFAVKVVTELYKLLKITDIDVATCVSDVGRADVNFRDFGQDIVGKNYSRAATDLARGLSSLSTSIAACGTTEVQAKLDMLAAAVHWANISTAGLDKTVKFVVDASDLWEDIDALGTAAAKQDTSALASSIQKLLTDWSTIVGGCGNSTACQTLDGVLRVAQVVAANVAPCEAALGPSVKGLEEAAALFSAHVAYPDYKKALGLFATALDGFATAISSDACGLKTIGTTIGSLAPKLNDAVITIENSTAVKILVGSADVYDEIYKACTDLESGNYVDFGTQMGLLISDLQASGCTTQSCTLLQGILSSLKVELGSNDFTACAADIDGAWNLVPTAIQAFEQGKWVDGVKYIGSLLGAFASSVKGCHLDELATILEETASKMGANATATDIGTVAQILVQGSDVTLDVQKLLQDFNGNAWNSVGHDLGTLSNWLADTHCTTFACKLVEGMLNAAAIPFQDLNACKGDLDDAQASFTAGAASMAHKEWKDGLTYWSTSLFQVSKAVQDCGLAKELGYIQQEAATLGFGNVTMIGEVAQILVHGIDLGGDINSAYQAFSSHDYRTAGTDMVNIMNELSQWTAGHACTNDFCYVVTGMMQFLGDIEGDIQACEADLELGFRNFTHGFEKLLDRKASDKHGDFHFTTHSTALQEGIQDMGYGLQDVAKGAVDCHLGELATILGALGVKLGIAPEITWLEKLLSIIINGVHIENELGAACLDYGAGNWVGFGYNLARLTRTLL